jgi:Fur family ferric uptake transcriptional regulator
VTEIEPDVATDLVDSVAVNHGFQTDVRHLTLFGTCRDCS